MYKFDEWVQGLKEKKDIKMYKHFDVKIDLNRDEDIKKIEKSIRNLTNHQFLPFIKRVNIEIRYRRKECNCGRLELGKNCIKSCLYREKQKSKKQRPIMYASNLDSYIYSYYNYLVYEFYDKKIKANHIDRSITAYRKVPTLENPQKNKCNIHFASEAFQEIKKHESCVVITADITKFFDELNHILLKNNLENILSVNRLGPLIYKIYKSLTRYKYINYYPDFKKTDIRHVLRNKKGTPNVYLKLKNYIKKSKSNIGIPQGSPISGLFSNIYMYEFDLAFKKNFPDSFYRRYSDDIFIVCSEAEKEEIYTFLLEKIKTNHLKIQPGKTNISYLNKNIITKVTDGDGKLKRRKYIDYLGFEFYGDKILMRKKSLGKLRDRQENKVQKMLGNTSYKFKPVLRKRSKIKSNYLKKSLSMFKNIKIEKQIRSLSRRRNNIKREGLDYKNNKDS